jgi:cell division protein FtsB
MVVVACLGLTAYFTHHAISGRHGLEARRHLMARLPQLETRIASLEISRQKLQREVALLGSDFPSRDLVEEIARDVLGYVLPSEIVWVGQ